MGDAASGQLGVGIALQGYTGTRTGVLLLQVPLDVQGASTSHRYMARQAHIIIPGCPHHVVHRGNLRVQVFFCDDDRSLTPQPRGRKLAVHRKRNRSSGEGKYVWVDGQLEKKSQGTPVRVPEFLIRSEGEKLLKEVITDAVKQYCKEGLSTGDEYKMFSFSFGVDLTTVIFSMGRSVPSLVTFGELEWVCCKHEWKYKDASLHYWVKDRFEDPYDIFNIIPGTFEAGGVPYDILGYWTDVRTLKGAM